MVPGELSLSLYWQKATADGAEKLEAEGLRYRRREPGEFHPVENAEAEAPEEGEEQTGPPQEGEEPPAITVAGGEPVEGEPVAAGEKLEAHAGKWTGAGHLLYKYQWQRCSAGCESESSWQLIKGARKARYTLTQEDVGCSIRFLVTVTGREEPAMTVPSSQLTEIVEGAGEAEEAKETTHVNFSKDRPEEIEPEEIFAYRIGSTRNGARLEAEPYAVIFTTDGKHTESDLGKGRTRRMVLTPAG